VIRALSLIVLMMLLVPAVVVSAPQAAAQPAAPATQGAAAAPTADAQKPADPLEPQGYAYKADGRRDPFVNLMRRGSEISRSAGDVRPAGLPGLTASEVTLSGIMASRGGFVAMLRATDKRTYVARQGDKLLDGTIRSITADTMVILQPVNDPLSLEKQREVRKVLRQTEEAK